MINAVVAVGDGNVLKYPAISNALKNLHLSPVN